MRGQGACHLTTDERRGCLTPATSFTELTGPAGRETAIGRADGGLLFFAGLWDRCENDGGYSESCAMPMIDAVARDDVAPFDNRQPVILDAPGAAVWLDLAADPAPVLRAPPAAGALAADPPEPAGR
jgi:putative SOS response-associated peptidase YedK